MAADVWVLGEHCLPYAEEWTGQLGMSSQGSLTAGILWGVITESPLGPHHLHQDMLELGMWTNNGRLGSFPTHLLYVQHHGQSLSHLCVPHADRSA